MGDKRPDVELRIPADSAYLAVLRTPTAGLAARLDFTLDDIEDLRMAVGEASALALPAAEPGSGRKTCPAPSTLCGTSQVPPPTRSRPKR